MNRKIKQAQMLRDKAKNLRKRGDALTKLGRKDEAQAAYSQGVDVLEESVSLLELLREEDVADDLAESIGSKAGMLARLGGERSQEALSTYEKGAKLEDTYSLPSTYNRLNFIKRRLVSGSERLSDLLPEIKGLASFIEDQLRNDTEMSDSGWAWADLGDCYGLMGDIDQAQVAYSNFIRRAEIKSPETTLKVLNDLADRLKEFDDPDASKVRQTANLLQDRL